MNTDINKYNNDDLYEIFGISSHSSEFEINSIANKLIEKMKNKQDIDTANFLVQARDKLLKLNSASYYDSDDSLENPNSNVGKWNSNQYLSQNNYAQNDKITDRTQQVQTWTDSDNHFQMKQNQLGVNNSYNVPISQDSLNPFLQNINVHHVMLDSQFRQTLLPYNAIDANYVSSSTNYSVNLTDTLTNVVSIQLQNVNIPNTWYRFSSDQGNIVFSVIYENETALFTLPEGNYTPDDLVYQLNEQDNWTYESTHNLVFAYDSNKHKIYFTTSESIIFSTVDDGLCNTVSYNNKNLLWCLGLRDEANLPTTFEGDIIHYFPAVVDTFGPKYFVVVLDDYNKNRQNHGLINIANMDSKLSLPSYYNSDLNYDCDITSDSNYPYIQASAPRRITRKQMYSVNEILSNRIAPRERNQGTNASDVFAILPIKNKQTDYDFGQPYIFTNIDMDNRERTYFGPVNINRFKLKLMDDKGSTVNLNGADWSLSLIVKSLYQY